MDGATVSTALRGPNRRRLAKWYLGFTTVVLIGLVEPWTAKAQSDAAPQRAIDAARDALGNPTWYEPENDKPRAIPVRSAASDEENRFSRWDPKPDRAKTSNPQNPNLPATPAAGGAGTNLGVGELLGWSLLIVVLILVTAAIIYAFMNREKSLDGDTQAGTSDAKKKADLESKLEKLPVKVNLSFGDLLGQARHYATQGDYRLAIICLYSHLLITLDSNHRIRLTLGKTNRQYLRELGSNHPQRKNAGEVIHVFEWIYFGGKSPNARHYETTLERVLEVQQSFATVPEAAA